MGLDDCIYCAFHVLCYNMLHDYVATEMEKVRKFEDGLKLLIQGKIMGLLLQDMDLMVKTTMPIEREVDDAWNIWEAGVEDK